MLLQTILQLHILLAATPALAGWTLFAPVIGQGVPVRILNISRTFAAAVDTPSLRISVAKTSQQRKIPAAFEVSELLGNKTLVAGVEQPIARPIEISSSAQSPRAP